MFVFFKGSCLSESSVKLVKTKACCAIQHGHTATFNCYTKPPLTALPSPVCSLKNVHSRAEGRDILSCKRFFERNSLWNVKQKMMTGTQIQGAYAAKDLYVATAHPQTQDSS